MAIFSRPDMYSGREVHPIAVIVLHIQTLQKSTPLSKGTYHRLPPKDTLNSRRQAFEAFSSLLPRYSSEFQNTKSANTSYYD